MTTIDNQDARWAVFKLTSLTQPITWDDPLVLALAKAVREAHQQLPMIKVQFNITPGTPKLEINFIGGQVWTVLLHDRNSDGPISYDISVTSQRKRSHVLASIASITAVVVDCYVGGIDTIEILPRP